MIIPGSNLHTIYARTRDVALFTGGKKMAVCDDFGKSKRPNLFPVVLTGINVLNRF